MTFEDFEAEPDPGHFGIRVVDALWRTEWLTGRLAGHLSQNTHIYDENHIFGVFRRKK